MNLYTPCLREHITQRIERVWNLVSVPGSTLTEDVGVGVAKGKLLMPVYFASLSHPDDKHWQSVFIPLNSGSDVGISLTWWARRAGLSGSTNVKIDTQNKWLSTLKSKVAGGGYLINSIMCPPKNHLPARTKYLDLANNHPSWIPSYAVDEETVADGAGLSSDDYYAGLLGSTALINDFVRSIMAREDVMSRIEEFQDSPLTCFGSEKADELRFLESFKKVLEVSLDAPLEAFGNVKKGKAGSATMKVEVEKPATKEEMYAGVWGAFG